MIPTELLAIGQRLRTQDNRYTADPMFCVQGLNRIYGLDDQWTDNYAWVDTSDGFDVLPDPDTDEQEEDYESNSDIHHVGYHDEWETVTVFFTDQAAQEYIEYNKHRLARFQEVRVFVESFYRCPEMLVIRKWLMSLPEHPEQPTQGEVES